MQKLLEIHVLVSVNKVLLEHGFTCGFPQDHGCFCTTRTELRRGDRDHRHLKDKKNILPGQLQKKVCQPLTWNVLGTLYPQTPSLGMC